MLDPKTPSSIRKIPLSEEAMKTAIRQISLLESRDLLDNFTIKSYATNERYSNFLFLNSQDKLWKTAAGPISYATLLSSYITSSSLYTLIRTRNVSINTSTDYGP